MKFSDCARRQQLSRDYARGEGIEVGPLHSAWPVHSSMRVKYVDRYTREELIKQYPELNADEIAPTHIIDDGRTLETIEKNSLDFNLSSHVLEHCDNPIATLKRWLSLLKVGGVCLGAVPDKDHTFDSPRVITDFNELRDAFYGNADFKINALHSFYLLVEKLEGEALDKAVQKAIDKDLHVHFPVWNANAFCDFISRLSHFNYTPKFKIEMFWSSGAEFLFALRRVAE